MKKYCTRCGKQFEAVGREVICPSCKAQAAEEVKKAAVLKAKRASWTGESVPVRISGRASTVIREFGALHTMTFAEALDALLRTTDYVASIGKAWEDITPYKSHRRDKRATDATDAPQALEVTIKSHDVKPSTATKTASKASKTANTVAKTTSKASKASKTTSKATSKPITAAKVSRAKASAEVHHEAK